MISNEILSQIPDLDKIRDDKISILEQEIKIIKEKYNELVLFCNALNEQFKKHLEGN